MQRLGTALLAALSVPAVAQVATGRTMQLLAPAVIGQTVSFRIASPATAAGNFYVVLWCAPPFAGTAALSVPGFTLLGAVLVDPPRSVSAVAGHLGATGSATHGVTIPNDLSFVGYAWDLQSADFDASTPTLWFSDDELTLVVANTPAPNMVWIPAGTFPMGSNAGPPDGVPPYNPQANERPVHQVTISRPFWIGRHEVTQAEYQALMGTNPSFHQGPAWPNSGNQPVEMVAHNAAMAYCAALTAQQAAIGRVPTGYQYRLPTEAEWEYCCRAGTTTEFHCGPTLVCGQANFYYSMHTGSSCNSLGTAVVGSYAANAWGLHDMHGNVWEWCLDAWDGSANYPSGPVVDPFVQSGPWQVYRGGSWMGNSYYCRSACRSGGYMPGRHLGFRVVLAPVLP